jgi:hypothetical protein
MFVRWQRRVSTAWWRQKPHTRKNHPAHWAAILVESVRVKGKPTQRHIAYLAGIKEERLGELNGRCRFYMDVVATLDRLGNQVSAEERKQIETTLMRKVPCPTWQEYQEFNRHVIQVLGPGYARPVPERWPR